MAIHVFYWEICVKHVDLLNRADIEYERESTAGIDSECTKSGHDQTLSMRNHDQNLKPVALSIALVFLVFTIDLLLPLGVASAVPYTFAVLLALRAKPNWIGPAVAFLCMFLTLLKLGLVSERGTTELWKVLANRGLAIFAIGMTAFLGILRRKADEERELAHHKLREHQQSLAHMGRLSLLGQVTAGVAHELNQPLAALRLQAELAVQMNERNGVKESPLAKSLQEISTQATRAGEIVKGIRRLARRSTAEMKPVDLGVVIADVLAMLDGTIRREKIEIAISNPLIQEQVIADRIQIEQVIYNIIQNAIEANPKRIDIGLKKQQNEIILTVRDNGTGIDPTIQPFEPFATTKPEGLGLGLSICREIISSHHGRIELRSTQNHTALIVTLPALEKNAP